MQLKEQILIDGCLISSSHFYWLEKSGSLIGKLTLFNKNHSRSLFHAPVQSRIPDTWHNTQFQQTQTIQKKATAHRTPNGQATLNPSIQTNRRSATKPPGVRSISMRANDEHRRLDKPNTNTYTNNNNKNNTNFTFSTRKPNTELLVFFFRLSLFYCRNRFSSERNCGILCVRFDSLSVCVSVCVFVVVSVSVKFVLCCVAPLRARLLCYKEL